MAEARKQSNRLWLWLGSAVLLVVVFFSVRAMTRGKQEIHAAEATEGPLSSTISTNGHVEPITNYEFHSPISTTVKAIYVQPGDKVPAGKLLMVLDDTDARARLASAESGVKTAQAGLDAVLNNGTQEQRQAGAADETRARLERDQAQSSLDALIKLQSTGAASAAEVASARQRLASAEASLKAAQSSMQNRYSSADVARAKAALADAEAGLAAAREVISKTEIHAPAAGTVYSIDVGRMEFVDQGKTLLEMADLDQERVRAYFDEPEIGRLAVGQPVSIKWDAKQGLKWQGVIERVPVTVITVGTRTVGETLVRITGGDGQLLPQTNVTVTVTTSSAQHVLSVPREALYTENGQPFVYKVEGDRLVRTPVTTGTINLTQVAIVSGIKAGDQVATGTITGQPLQTGIPVKVVQ
ncbi:MAG TPA: efflux RND transporter periplasmic adaptor subunit [Terracidiphilus sp.]|jgi:HlyD family secretion protein|nr:efflux RND transporter periplasmic adaptor subunit [Terracidiphilus sp.]